VAEAVEGSGDGGAVGKVSVAVGTVVGFAVGAHLEVAAGDVFAAVLADGHQGNTSKKTARPSAVPGARVRMAPM